MDEPKRKVRTEEIGGENISVLDNFDFRRSSLMNIFGAIGITEFYKWKQGKIKGSYSLEIFKHNERNMATHRLTLEHPHLRTGGIDTLLHIERVFFPKKDPAYSSQYGIYFSKGKYMHCGSGVLSELRLFQRDIIQYFDINNFSEFSKYFVKSNLPKTHKEAVRDFLL